MQFTQNANTYDIVLASKSPIKLEAVMTFFVGKKRVLTVETKTDYVQPIGKAQARKCLLQRLICVPFNISEGKMIIAIENYIYRGHGDSYYDNVMIAVQHPDGDIYFSSGIDDNCAVKVPNEAIADISEDLMTHTVGDILHGKYTNCDPKDWFAQAGCTYSRVEQIVMAMYGCASIFYERVHYT